MEKSAKPPEAPPSRAANSSGRKEDWIGRQLRRVYDDVASEPLPDDLMSLLDQLGGGVDGATDKKSAK